MGGVGTRILAVEDDERIRSAVKLALEDEGWTVDEAESGEQAIELFQRASPDVVLIDIMLPGIDGFELCRTIRRTSDVPVVMVTARNDTHDIVAGLEAGADDYLTKPFAAKELSARIRALLRRIRPVASGHARLVFGEESSVFAAGRLAADFPAGRMADRIRPGGMMSISAALSFADARGLKVVFQGGIQGESWLTSGGTQSALEQLISSRASTSA